MFNIYLSRITLTLDLDFLFLSVLERKERLLLPAPPAIVMVKVLFYIYINHQLLLKIVHITDIESILSSPQSKMGFEFYLGGNNVHYSLKV